MTKPTFKFSEETSQSWAHRDPDYNALFIKTIQNFSNDALRINGYLFLNDVLKNLGLKPTKEGQVTGWVVGNGAGFVHIEFEELPDGSALMLKFNIDGVILDQVKWG